MKVLNRLFVLAFILILIQLTSRCKKDEESTPTNTVTDIDGNIYNTITIGKQVWMKENLKTTKYKDGTPIPNITDAIAWSAITTTSGAYCDYDNTPGNSTTCGKLYNYFAVVDANKLCPRGWHIPTDTEWTTLEHYLIENGYNWDGTITENKIGKSMASTSGWITDPLAGNTGNYQASNNSSGFTALPCGYRSGGGTYYSIGVGGFWWSSSEVSAANACGRNLYNNHSYIYRFSGSKRGGFSVRCLRD